jgi:predicted MFS family arabinose efflux permease
LGTAVIVFSASTVCVAFASQFWHLVLLRMVLAVG